MQVGDLVKIREDDRFDDSGLIGLVKWVNLKYPPQCGLMLGNGVEIYDVRFVEVISENR